MCRISEHEALAKPRFTHPLEKLMTINLTDSSGSIVGAGTIVDVRHCLARLIEMDRNMHGGRYAQLMPSKHVETVVAGDEVQIRVGDGGPLWASYRISTRH